MGALWPEIIGAWRDRC